MTHSLTIYKLALEILLKYHYNKAVIPLIKKLYTENKAGYYGGISEVYKPYASI